MGPKVKTGAFVVCDRPEAPGERFLAKVAQYTHGDTHCYLIEYILQKNDRVKRINNEFVIEVDKVIVIPKDAFNTVGSRTTVRVKSEITKLLQPRIGQLSPTEEGKPAKLKRKNRLGGENKRKKKKIEEDEDFGSSDESEWEQYQPELWESNQFPLAAECSCELSSITETPTTSVAPIPNSTTVTNSIESLDFAQESKSPAMTIEVNQKPQRKTRIPRESKREVKTDPIRSDAQLASPSLSASRHQLPGVISCPNKRYKAVVEIKGKTYPVPGLFDSDIEAAVARDEFLVRKCDSASQTTFRVDQSGLLFYGYGVHDPTSQLSSVPPKRKEDHKRDHRNSDKSSKNDALDSSALPTPENSSSLVCNHTSAAVQAAHYKWWWDQLFLDQFLNDSTCTDNRRLS